MSGLGRLEIRLLGSFRVLVDGRPVDDQFWGRRKSRTLIKLLALAPDREMHREQLGEMLWPEAEAGLAQNNLHKTVHAARRALEPDLKDGRGSQYLQTVEERLALVAPGGVWIDAEEFERRAGAALAAEAGGDLEAALEQYSGDLLPEDRYEDWAAAPRERLSRLYQELLARTAVRAEAAGLPAKAMELWQRTLAADGTNERAHRALMQLHATAGNRHLALAQFKQCQEMLRVELDAAPEAATLELYEQIAAGGASTGVVAGGRAADYSRVSASDSAAFASRPDHALQNRTPGDSGTAARTPAPDPVRAVWRRRLWLGVAGFVALAAAVAFVWVRGGPAGSAIRSIAVLPFQADGHLDYVAEGLTESLISNLSGLPGVRVMARSTVFQYRGQAGKEPTDPREAGRALQVEGVVTGSVRAEGNRLVLEAELVDVRDGARVWGRRLTLDDARLSTAQAQLSFELAAALGLRPGSSQLQHFEQPQTAHAEAYRNYLLGRYHFSRRTPEAFRKAEQYLRQAVAQDPVFAAAYTGLADVYGLMGYRHAPPREYFPKAAAMVAKALELDPQSADAYTSLGMIQALYEWDWPAAQAAFRRALELNPGHATAHHWYGVHLNSMKRWEEAEVELGRALELDPLSCIIQTNAAYPLHYRRRYDQAAQRYRKVFELDPNFVVAHEEMMMIYDQTHRYRQALDAATAMQRAFGDAEVVAVLEGARAGQAADGWRAYRAGLEGWVQVLLRRRESRFVPPIQIAQLYLRIGDRQRALDWLERSYAEKSVPIVYIGADPQYDPLRKEPRFQDLIAKLQLP